MRAERVTLTPMHYIKDEDGEADPPTPDEPAETSSPTVTTEVSLLAPLQVENPLLKSVWTEEDLVLVLILLEASSGRRGHDAVEHATAILPPLNRAIARVREANKTIGPTRLEVVPAPDTDA